MKSIDTSVAVDYLRDRPDAVAAVEGAILGGESLVASEIVRFELLAGVRPGEECAVERFSSRLGWVPVDEAVSRLAARLAVRHRPANVGIEDADYVIAATALELGSELLTTNVRRFPMLPGLRPAY